MRLAQAAIVVCVFAGVVSALRRAGSDALRLDAEIHSGWLAACGALYLASILPAGLYWHGILKSLDQRPRWFESLRAYYIGHLGKYVPGKALVVVLRVWLVQSPRTDARVAAASVVLETLTMMAVGAFWAATILLVQSADHAALVWLSLALMLVSVIPTLPPVFRLLVRLVPGIPRDAVTIASLDRFNWRLMAAGWLVNSVGWAVMGLSLWAALKSIGVTEVAMPAGMPLLTAAVALAVVAGFLSGIPGGALVRESLIWLVLAQHVSQGDALFAAIVLRFAWLLSELVLAGILYPVGARPRVRTLAAAAWIGLLAGSQAVLAGLGG
jgi:uncharacterized membrane protein YbhN (UPF0104 family)